MSTLTLFTLAVTGALLGGSDRDEKTLHQDGSLKVIQRVDWSPTGAGEMTYNSLMIGGIDRGRSYLKPAAKELHGVKGKDYSLLPTCYHHPASPVGVVMQLFQPFDWPDEGGGIRTALRGKATPPKVGVVGMYVGTMAAYAGPKQVVHFYESNPKVVELSLPKNGEPYFTYVKDAQKRGAEVKVFEGKERATFVAKAPKRFYNVLVVEIATRERLEDILVELHTKEGMSLLLDSLADGGILCYHISNQFVNVEPVLADVAQSLGCASVVGADAATGYAPVYGSSARYTSKWVMIARKQNTLQRLQPPPGYEDKVKSVPKYLHLAPYWQKPEATGKHVWTDDSKHHVKGLLYGSPFVTRVGNHLTDVAHRAMGSWQVSEAIRNSNVVFGLSKLVAEYRENDGQTIEDLQKGYEK